MVYPKKSLLHMSAKNGAADHKTSSNPFHYDDELDSSKALKSSSKVSAEPTRCVPSYGGNPFDAAADDHGRKGTAPSGSEFGFFYAQRSRYKNGFRDSGGLESQSVEELENYAIYKSEETTATVDNCLKIASEMQEDATRTLITLHQQGEQITRTHETVAGMDHDLSRGEKLLGSLGGMFSKTWKPKKTRPITGPVVIRDNPATRSGAHLAQREKLGLGRASNGQMRARTPPPEPTNALQKVEVEKANQDDGLSKLSDMLGELKEMAIDMGSEIDWQNKALDGFEGDVTVISDRVGYANNRGRRLLRK